MQKVATPEVQQEKTSVTNRKYRGKSTSFLKSASERVVVKNNALSKKDKINIFDINPMLKIGVDDADGELLKGGGGIANGRPSHKQSEKDVGKDLGPSGKSRSAIKMEKKCPTAQK